MRASETVDDPRRIIVLEQKFNLAFLDAAFFFVSEDILLLRYLS